MPRKKKTPVVTPAIDLPQEFLEKLIPGPMDTAGVEAVFQQLKKAVIERKRPPTSPFPSSRELARCRSFNDRRPGCKASENSGAAIWRSGMTAA